MIKWLVVGISVASLMGGTPLRGQSYTVTVQPGSRQTFTSFGASQTTEYTDGNLPVAVRNQMASMVFNGLHAKILRLWLSSADSVSLASMESQFFSTYVTSGAITNIMNNGVTTLLLAPANGHAATTNILIYTSKIAQVVSDLKTQRGIIINVTGLDNEPDGWTASQIAEGVKDLRAALDGSGLTNVQVIAPESASADSGCDADIDAMYNDVNSWNSIMGIASHSYNMAATANEAHRTYGKQYWITEASLDGNELAEDDNEASTIAARFLNDMNHMVTHWVFFIGFGDSVNVTTDQDDSTKMMVYNRATGTIQVDLKYYYFQQLLTAFAYGAVFRSCVSSSEGDMVYTYGQKPRVNVAAAVNPDGSWGIGIDNDTGVTLNYPPRAMWYSGVNTNVTVTIGELVGTGNKNFTLYHSRPGEHFVKDGVVTMTNGTITVAITAKELICLRSVMGGLPSPSGLVASVVSSNQINLNWTDNSTNETGFILERKTGSGGVYASLATLGADATAYNDTGLAPGTAYNYEVAATNNLGSSSWSGEASATTSGGGVGSLSGAVAAIASGYNLTMLGTNDWAHWNGAFIHKASGGTQISDVIQIGGGSYGAWHDTSRSITWTDGTPTLSGTGDNNYIWCNGTANSGWTFTVPADTASRTLHVVCGGPANAIVKIAAHLSDGSTSDYTDTETSTGYFTREYTIRYQAASAGQTLTITIVHTNFGSQSCDLDAAWLTGGDSSSLLTPTSLTATYSADSQSLVISWPTVPGGFTLESSTSLDAPNWSDVTNPVVVVGGSNTVTLEATGNAKFFRLH